MTDNAGLVERLRAAAAFEGLGTVYPIIDEAAQALTAAEAEIARLTRERDEALRACGAISAVSDGHAQRALAAETALTETRAMLAEAVEALNYCEQYGSAAVKLLARSTLTKLQEAGHD